MSDKPGRKTQTSTEVKARYNKKAYKQYVFRLRYDADLELIDYIERLIAKSGESASTVICSLVKKGAGK